MKETITSAEIQGLIVEFSEAVTDAVIYFKKKFGEQTTVQNLLSETQRLHKDIFEGWLLAQKVELTEALIHCGADVHVYKDYALRVASRYGRTKVVRLLLGNGADIHAERGPALCFSSKFGHIEVMKLLLGNGADVNANEGLALWSAIDNGQTEAEAVLREAMEEVA